jgi:GT2 family glycosyltransferase
MTPPAPALSPPTQERLWRNSAPAPDQPRLSVLVPVFAYDSRAMLARLAKTKAIADVELIFLDDGSPTPGPAAAIKAAAQEAPIAVTLIEGRANVGRARARNRLLQAARGTHVLLLDADMVPDTDDFLDHWIGVIAAHAPAIAFGGFTVDQAPHSAATDLHRFVAKRSDCRSVEERSKDPAQFTTTSNLLIRADIAAAVPFDEGFSGWGWEDVDWAIRAHARFPILHVDITATHAGLDDEDTLLRKAERAGANYRRIIDKHPQAARNFRSFQTARVLQRIPGVFALKPMFAAIARQRALPLMVRNIGYKMFRTLSYAAHLR